MRENPTLVFPQPQRLEIEARPVPVDYKLSRWRIADSHARIADQPPRALSRCCGAIPNASHGPDEGYGRGLDLAGVGAATRPDQAGVRWSGLAGAGDHIDQGLDDLGKGGSG